MCMNACTRNKQEREWGVVCDGSVQNKMGYTAATVLKYINCGMHA